MRKAILDDLRAAEPTASWEKQKKQKIVFDNVLIRVAGEWIWFSVSPRTQDSQWQGQTLSGLMHHSAGHWRVVDLVPGTLLVNTGNLMVRWTNGQYLSTKHRVINTFAVDRYSIPVFFGPSGDALIECLASCQGPGRPPRYEPTTYRALRNWYYGSYE